MKLLETMDPESKAFLSELYTESGGDARHGVPYATLIDALGFDEVVEDIIAIQRTTTSQPSTSPNQTTAI